MTDAEWLASADPQRMLDHIAGKASDRKLRLFAVACCRRIWHLLTDDAPCGRCDGRGSIPWGAGGQTVGMEPRRQCRICSGTGRINRSQRAVEAAERYADALITKDELAAARGAAWHAASDAASDAACDAAWVAARGAARVARTAAWSAAKAAACVASWDAEKKEQSHLLRDIFGNPWRPMTTEKQYLTDAKTKALVQNYAFQQTNPPIGGGLSQQERETYEAARNYCIIRESWLAWHDGLIPRMAQQIYTDRAFDQMPILADALEEAGCIDEFILSHLRGLDVLPDEEMPNKYRWTKLRGPHVRGCWVLDLLLRKE